MKMGASSLMIGGLANSVSAGDSSPDDSIVETESISYYKSLRLLSYAESSKPVNELVEFLNEQKQASVEYFDVEGHRVSWKGGPEFIVLNTPLSHPTDNNAKLSIRVFDEDAEITTASASVKGQVFKSNPEIISSDTESADSIEAAAAGDDADYDIVNAVQWAKHNSSDDEVGAMSVDCLKKETFDPGEPAPDWVCKITATAGSVIGSVGTVMVLFPEPGSSAVGAVAIGAAGTISGGTCIILDTVEDKVDEWDPRKVTFCLTWDCSGYLCTPEVRLYLGDY